MVSLISGSFLKSYYDKDYFESGNKSGYKNYNKGFNYYKHMVRAHQRVISLIMSFHPKRVLDLGCAFGYTVMTFRSLGVEAYGVDISEYAVKNAPSKVKPYLKVADIKHIPFKDNFFDLVVSYDVLEHVPKLEIPQVLREIKRVSSKNILLDIFINNKVNKIFKVEDPSHVSVFEVSEWKNFFEEAGLKLEKQFLIPAAINLRSKIFCLKAEGKL